MSNQYMIEFYRIWREDGKVIVAAENLEEARKKATELFVDDSQEIIWYSNEKKLEDSGIC